MKELLFCDKCGGVGYDDGNSFFMKPNKKCSSCGIGRYVETGIEHEDACNIIEKEYDINLGNYSFTEKEEFFRKKFFYGHSFDHSTPKAIKRRLTWEQNCTQSQNVNTPRCPSCGSTNLSHISTTQKIVKVGVFGRLGTGDLGKTYKCNNCGVKF